jgi:hypothetical protein
MDDFKWPAIMFVCIAICAAAVGACRANADRETAKTAMENGYVQTIDEETKQPIWVKAE